MSFTDFEVSIASLEQAARIRHEVFCEGMDYWETNSLKQEIDRHDAASSHCVLSTRSGDPVGCIRLVRTNHNNPLLPFEFACQEKININRSVIGEISRLAIRSSYRKSKSPFILAALYLSALAMAEQQGVKTVFLFVEQRLADHLLRLGVKVEQIGPYIDYRGLRAPFMLEVASVTSKLRPSIRPLWDYVKGSIEPEEVV